MILRIAMNHMAAEPQRMTKRIFGVGLRCGV
jgi:hypothetical protein